MEKLINWNKLQKYIETASSKEDTVLAELNRYTHLSVVHPNMLSGHIQGKVLEMFSRMLNPHYILEIGTYTGYSAICLARGLNSEGKLFTIDINDELKNIALSFFHKAAIADKIELLTGDAIQIIPSLNYEFDLAFIDAEKEQYIDYYELIINKIRPGGFILADNTLWDGKVLNKPESWDPTTSAIHSFNHYVQNDPRVENVLLSVRDGLSIIRKLNHE
jgi:caffeoyl-CoA O-methyltransferase